MAARKSFLLRIDGGVLDAVRAWADDDLRSLNGHVEYLLRQALRQHGRRIKESGADPTPPESGPDEPAGVGSD
jgi:hypothetical protein